jgi:hypothetical protein
MLAHLRVVRALVRDIGRFGSEGDEPAVHHARRSGHRAVEISIRGVALPSTEDRIYVE